VIFRVRWIKDAGHFDNLEQPGQVADAINDFIVRSRTWKRTCAALLGAARSINILLQFRQYTAAGP